MKKVILLVVMIGMFLAGSAYAGSPCDQKNEDQQDGYQTIKLTCTADASTAAFASTTVILNQQAHIYEIVVDPDNTATPTDGYNIGLVGTIEGDLDPHNQLDGMDTTSTAPVTIRLTESTNVTGNMTLTFTGNLVNSAVTVLRLKMVR